jgi:hypothetical protein
MKKGLELPGEIFLSWFIAGSILTGGFLVAYGTISQAVSMYAILYAVAGLYFIGGLLGFIFGGALGMFGRPLVMKAKEALNDQVHAMLYMLPAAAIGFVVAGWIALTLYSFYTMSFWAIFFTSIAWLLGMAVVGWALNRGIDGAVNVGKRIKRLTKIRVKVSIEE